MVIRCALAFPIVLAGCNTLLGIDDHELATAVGDDAGAVDGPSPSADSGADVSSTDGSSGVDGSGACAPGTARCDGNTPQQCVGGAWQSLTPCGGLTPVCSNGLCGPFRTTGGIRSTAPAPAGSGIRLVAGGFETGTRTCSAKGVCVTGGIVP
jgi:hypothetical protein